MVVKVTISPDGSDIELGKPAALFESSVPNMSTYTVAPDGQRFLMIKESNDPRAGTSDINIIVNWIEELKQRLPAN